MLTEKNNSDFETLKTKIMDLLSVNEVIDVVYKRLYLDKEGKWSERSHFDMGGLSLGKLKPEKLLKSFIFASIGFDEIPEEILEEKKLLIFESLIMKMKETLERLETIKNIN